MVSLDKNMPSKVGLSGCYDCAHNAHFEYGRTYWQPWLTQQLKASYLLKQPHASILAKSGRVDLQRTLSSAVRSITDFDEATVVPFNGYADIDAYYADMSLARGDKLARVAVPLLALHAVDDPIVWADNFEASIARTPPATSSEKNPNCWFRITRGGGHVGWSLGVDPRGERWLFMNLAVVDFAEAILAVVPREGEA
ncbi:hypothetical protein T492DRAFT_332355 [Pavlovales sp. CCMP2436]|nr:hypothetical protein T492DRAFT_332355 [Pavlovales sp. CCMP2436]